MISIIIPTLNEINNIDSTINKIKNIFSNNEDYEIIFVDDESNDGSLEKIKTLSNIFPNISYIIPNQRLGLGYALSIGQKNSKGEFILFLDCDNSINKSDLTKLINCKEKNKLVIGSRYLNDSKINGVNNIKIFLSKFFNYLISYYLKIPAKDISHSFRIFPKSIILSTKNLKHPIFFWEHSLYCKKKGLEIKEIPITFDERISGKSKNSFYSLFKNIFFSFRSIINLKFIYK